MVVLPLCCSPQVPLLEEVVHAVENGTRGCCAEDGWQAAHVQAGERLLLEDRLRAGQESLKGCDQAVFAAGHLPERALPLPFYSIVPKANGGNAGEA